MFIRTGNGEEALKAAHILKTYNEPYLWNRLKVIALEDVGLANPDLCSQVLWVAGKHDWKNKHHGSDFILNYIIYQLCRSTKCRALDDTLYVADRHPSYAQQRLIYSELDEYELYVLFFDKTLNVIEHTLACWYLTGTKRYRADGLALKKGNPKAILDLAQEIGLPPHLYDLLRLSRGQEYFVCLLPCILQLEQSQKTSIVEEIKASSPMVIPPYLGGF